MRKKASPFYIFRHYATYRKLRKKFKKFFLRAFVVSSCRKSGFRVFLSLRYGADLGPSRLVSFDDTHHRLSRDSAQILTILIENRIYRSTVPLPFETYPEDLYITPLIREYHDSYIYYIDTTFCIRIF